MTASNYLVTGRNKQYLLHEIRDALKNATSIEIAVSFIRMSGLSLIIQDIEDAMNSEERNVKLSLLTSDYMNITEPQALKRLMLLKERGAEIQIFESKQATSFHLKSYIFVKNSGKRHQPERLLALATSVKLHLPTVLSGTTELTIQTTTIEKR